jgi:hypothetical protein
MEQSARRIKKLQDLIIDLSALAIKRELPFIVITPNFGYFSKYKHFYLYIIGTGCCWAGL